MDLVYPEIQQKETLYYLSPPQDTSPFVFPPVNRSTPSLLYYTSVLGESERKGIRGINLNPVHGTLI